MVADGRAPELDGSRSRLLVVGCLDSMTAESQSFALCVDSQACDSPLDAYQGFGAIHR